MSGPIARGAYRDLVAEHVGAHRPAPEPRTAPYAAHFGARELDAGSVRAIDATPLERPTVRPWARSAVAAIRLWVAVVDEGAALRSTCHPDRANRVQTSADPSLGGREHDAIERVATVARAVRDARERVLDLSEACPLLAPGQAIDVGLLAIAGLRVSESTRLHGQPQKGTHWVRRQLIAEDLIDRVRDQWGVRIDAGHVAACAALIIAHVESALIASGEAGWSRAPRTTVPRRARGFASDPGARLRGGG